MAVRKKDHLLSVAQRMFCTRGFHAVSVDAILEEAGVARMTLYKNFGSKEDLIVATLRREDKLFRQWLASFVEARSTRPADRIESLFEGLHERFSSEGYYGCAFIRASVEFPDPTHPVHQIAREHRAQRNDTFLHPGTSIQGQSSECLAALRAALLVVRGRHCCFTVAWRTLAGGICAASGPPPSQCSNKSHAHPVRC